MNTYLVLPSTSALVALLPLLLALPACSGPADGEIPRAPSCSTGVTDGQKPATREVDIGYGEPAVYEPFHDGVTVTIEKTPDDLGVLAVIVRVKAESGDPDQACWPVRMAAGSAGSGGAGGSAGSGILGESVVFKLAGDSFYTDGSVFLPVDPGFVDVTTTVVGEDFSGTFTVHVDPEY